MSWLMLRDRYSTVVRKNREGVDLLLLHTKGKDIAIAVHKSR